MRHWLAVIGACGDLAQAVLACAPSGEATFLFDSSSRSGSAIQPCDVSRPRDVEQALDALPIEADQHWVLLSAVGAYQGAERVPFSWEALRHSIGVNLTGVAHFASGFASRVVSKKSTGRIVIVTSAAARVGSRDIGYGSAKAGLEGLVRSLSKSYASDGVTTIGVAPGIFDSRMSRRQAPDRRDAAIASGHLGRPTRLAEVAECVCFGLWSAPDSMTGTFMSPNAGQV